MISGRQWIARVRATEALGDLGRLFTPIMMVGGLGALTGIVYLSLLHLLQHHLGPELWGTWTRMGVMGGVGFSVGILIHWLGSPGDVELLVDNIHVLGGRKQYRELRSLIPVSLLCIAGGGAMGPEAPLVQTTGAIGTLLGERRKLGVRDHRVLTITGMAAGFTVLFGAPLGAAVFALEILHRRGLEYYEALMPAVIGSLWGYAVFTIATGWGLEPVWQFPPVGSLHVADMGWAVIAGVVGSVIALAFTVCHIALHKVMGWIPAMYRPALTGVMLALLGGWSMYGLTFGELQITMLLTAHPVISIFAIAAVAKLVGTSLTLAGGWKGGVIIPLFFIGLAVAKMMVLLLPGVNAVALIVGTMAAANTGVTKTPLGSTLVVSEMTGLQMLPTTLIAAMTSLVLTSPIGLIHTQRHRGD